MFLQPFSQLTVPADLLLVGILLQPLDKLLRASFSLLLVLHSLWLGNLLSFEETILLLPNSQAYHYHILLRLCSQLLIYTALRLFGMLLPLLDSLMRALFSLLFALHMLLLGSLPYFEETGLPFSKHRQHSSHGNPLHLSLKHKLKLIVHSNLPLALILLQPLDSLLQAVFFLLLA